MSAAAKPAHPLSSLVVLIPIILAALFLAVTIQLALKTLEPYKFLALNPQRTTDNTHTASPNIVVEPPLTEPLKTSLLTNFGVDYDVEPKAQPQGTVRIPVLTYHHLAPLPNSSARDYFVSPEIFDQQLAYLAEKNYRVLTPQEFYDQLKSGVNPTQKSVMLTFDDGNYDNYQYAFPILKKYGFTAVFYVPSARRGMNNAQLKEMADAGMIISPHGRTHMMLSKITDATTLYSELVTSKQSLDAITGQNSISFCYPGCEYNGAVTSTLAANGYSLAFSCGTSIDHKVKGRFYLSRMHVYNDMQHFKSILSGKAYYPSYSN